ncbi:MAG: SM-20-related protein [Thermoleophilaceae bacterium]|jgi:SM-20-related protein|nr:SM-20-related protein [Thermoleophilaceae bacterium]
MKSALDVASRLGVFVARDVLDAETAAELLAEVRVAPDERAPRYRASKNGAYIEKSKNSRLVTMPEERSLEFKERLGDLMPRIGEHFGLELTEQTDPSFLTYREGHHIPPHPDTRPEAEDRIVRDRKVTTVTFLNDDYEGGQLVLYGLLGPGTERHGLPVQAQTGTLVAFRSHVLHEVRPVTSGERQTVVSWYL